MRIPSTPRRTGARNKPVHFGYVSTEKGPPYEAYIAGPTWWGYLHMTRPSKPCVYEITGQQVACRFCGGSKSRVAIVKGWVPLYRRIDSAPICVPVDEVQRDGIDKLATFQKVVVGREKGKNAGVYVRAATNEEPKWSSTLPERQTEADITESLIRMWALPEVTSFFACGSDTALSLPKPAPAPVSDDPRTGGVDAGLGRILSRAGQAPSTNGKH